MNKNILRKKRVKRKLYDRELRRNEGKWIVTCEYENFYSVFHVNGKCLYKWGYDFMQVSLEPVDENRRLEHYYQGLLGSPFKSFKDAKKYIELYCFMQSKEVYKRYVDSYHRIHNKRRIML